MFFKKILALAGVLLVFGLSSQSFALQTVCGTSDNNPDSGVVYSEN